MLGLRLLICVWIMCAFSCAYSASPSLIVPAIVKKCDSSFYQDPLEQMVMLKDLMEHETELKAMIAHLKALKRLCDSEGLQFPNLSTFLRACRDCLSQGGFEIDDATFDWL